MSEKFLVLVYWCIPLLHQPKISYMKKIIFVFWLYYNVVMYGYLFLYWSVCLRSCLFRICLFILLLCSLPWHGIFCFLIITIFSETFDVAGRKVIRLVVLLYLGEVYIGISWIYFGDIVVWWYCWVLILLAVFQYLGVKKVHFTWKKFITFLILMMKASMVVSYWYINKYFVMCGLCLWFIFETYISYCLWDLIEIMVLGIWLILYFTVFVIVLALRVLVHYILVY